MERENSVQHEGALPRSVGAVLRDCVWADLPCAPMVQHRVWQFKTNQLASECPGLAAAGHEDCSPFFFRGYRSYSNPTPHSEG